MGTVEELYPANEYKKLDINISEIADIRNNYTLSDRLTDWRETRNITRGAMPTLPLSEFSRSYGSEARASRRDETDWEPMSDFFYNFGKDPDGAINKDLSESGRAATDAEKRDFPLKMFKRYCDYLNIQCNYLEDDRFRGNHYPPSNCNHPSRREGTQSHPYYTPTPGVAWSPLDVQSGEERCDGFLYIGPDDYGNSSGEPKVKFLYLDNGEWNETNARGVDYVSDPLKSVSAGPSTCRIPTDLRTTQGNEFNDPYTGFYTRSELNLSNLQPRGETSHRYRGVQRLSPENLDLLGGGGDNRSTNLRRMDDGDWSGGDTRKYTDLRCEFSDSTDSYPERGDVDACFNTDWARQHGLDQYECCMTPLETDENMNLAGNPGRRCWNSQYTYERCCGKIGEAEWEYPYCYYDTEWDTENECTVDCPIIYKHVSDSTDDWAVERPCGDRAEPYQCISGDGACTDDPQVPAPSIPYTTEENPGDPYSYRVYDGVFDFYKDNGESSDSSTPGETDATGCIESITIETAKRKCYDTEDCKGFFSRDGVISDDSDNNRYCFKSNFIDVGDGPLTAENHRSDARAAFYVIDNDCNGEWSTCSGDLCEKTWTSSPPARGTGTCVNVEGERENCVVGEPGYDTCPLTCEYGQPDMSGCSCGQTISGSVISSFPEEREDECTNIPSRTCEAGVGDCPLNANCVGEWSTCSGDLCQKTWTTTIPATGNGTCVNEGVTKACTQVDPGYDTCPLDCTYQRPDPSSCENTCAPLTGSVISVKPAGRESECTQIPTHDCQPEEGACPIQNCEGDWSECSATCEKTWRTTTSNSPNGTACPGPEPHPCLGDACPSDDSMDGTEEGDVDCILEWSDCNTDCVRTYSIIQQQSGNGEMCDTVDPNPECLPEEGACPIQDCVGNWSECDANCEKRWTTMIEPSANGELCPNLEPQSCDPGEGACPIPESQNTDTGSTDTSSSSTSSSQKKVDLDDEKWKDYLLPVLGGLFISVIGIIFIIILWKNREKIKKAFSKNSSKSGIPKAEEIKPFSNGSSSSVVPPLRN